MDEEAWDDITRYALAMSLAPARRTSTSGRAGIPRHHDPNGTYGACATRKLPGKRRSYQAVLICTGPSDVRSSCFLDVRETVSADLAGCFDVVFDGGGVYTRSGGRALSAAEAA